MKAKIKNDLKMMSEQSKFKRNCWYCNYKISFYAFEPDRKICKWCGRLNYKNELVEFKYLLEKRIKYASSCKR